MEFIIRGVTYGSEFSNWPTNTMKTLLAVDIYQWLIDILYFSKKLFPIFYVVHLCIYNFFNYGICDNLLSSNVLKRSIEFSTYISRIYVFLPNSKLSYPMIIEREVCKTTGSVAQFFTNRPERLQKHVPSLRPDEITGSQVYCRPAYFHYIL